MDPDFHKVVEKAASYDTFPYIQKKDDNYCLVTKKNADCLSTYQFIQEAFKYIKDNFEVKKKTSLFDATEIKNQTWSQIFTNLTSFRHYVLSYCDRLNSNSEKNEGKTRKKRETTNDINKVLKKIDSTALKHLNRITPKLAILHNSKSIKALYLRQENQIKEFYNKVCHSFSKKLNDALPFQISALSLLEDLIEFEKTHGSDSIKIKQTIEELSFFYNTLVAIDRILYEATSKEYIKTIDEVLRGKIKNSPPWHNLWAKASVEEHDVKSLNAEYAPKITNETLLGDLVIEIGKRIDQISANPAYQNVIVPGGYIDKEEGSVFNAHGVVLLVEQEKTLSSAEAKTYSLTIINNGEGGWSYNKIQELAKNYPGISRPQKLQNRCYNLKLINLKREDLSHEFFLEILKHQVTPGLVKNMDQFFETIKSFLLEKKNNPASHIAWGAAHHLILKEICGYKALSAHLKEQLQGPLYWQFKTFMTKKEINKIAEQGLFPSLPQGVKDFAYQIQKRRFQKLDGMLNLTP